MSRNRRFWPVMLLVVSCQSGSTEAAGQLEPMTVTFEPATLIRTGTAIPNVGLRCDEDMIILAHGKGDHLVTLGTITSTFYDSTGAQANTVRASASDWFGVTTMRGNDTAVAHRQPAGSGPFSLTNSLAYTDQFDSAKVATFMLKCMR
jgi:hypothetical protein